MQNLNKYDLETAWKRLASKNLNTSYSYVIYTILRSLVPSDNTKTERKPASTFIKRHFSPVRRPSKLANGRYVNDTMYGILSDLYYHKNLTINVVRKFGVEPDDEFLLQVRASAHDALVSIKRETADV